MATNILMPALSPTMTEGTLARWLKKEGDRISAGDVIAEIETDKATMEVEAVDEGVLGKILVPDGTEGVKVNAPIAVMADEGGAVASDTAAPKQDAGETAAPVQSTSAAPTPAPVAIFAKANGHAPEAAKGDRIFASPLAKRMAQQAGIDLAALKGSGPNGRIIRADVESARPGAASQTTQAAAPAPIQAPAPQAPATPRAEPITAPGQKIPLSNVKRVTARRLTEAKQTVPHFYVTIDVELDALLKLRMDLNAKSPKEGPGAIQEGSTEVPCGAGPWLPFADPTRQARGSGRMGWEPRIEVGLPPVPPRFRGLIPGESRAGISTTFGEHVIFRGPPGTDIVEGSTRRPRQAPGGPRQPPPRSNPPMRTVLTIGREPDNDFVIALPIVSGHHARLTWEGVPGQATLEDLGSSNGTAVGQLDRKVTRATLTAGETVFFGNHPVAAADLIGRVDPSMAPSLVFQGAEMVVGRDAGCQRVVDRTTVSGRHARFSRKGDRIVVEDLGSSNGTFVNGVRVEGPTQVRVGDLIGLGVESFRLATSPATVASTQRMEAVRPAIVPRPGPTLTMEPIPEAPIFIDEPASGPGWVYPLVLAGLLSQALVIGGVIGVIGAGSAMAPTGPAVATILSLMSLAATWFGLSTAVFGLLLDPHRPDGRAPGDSGFWLSRWAILGAVCLGECLLASVVAFPLGGLKGFGLPVLGLLMLATGVGSTVGTLIVLLAPRPAFAWAGLGVALVALGLLGGGPGALPRSAGIIRLASNAAPSRWAFEGLLVSEAEARPMVEASKDGPARDLAEDYFPVETDRMGMKADALALASMLLGLSGVGLFLVRFSGADR